ncbi:MAG: hypothetical protein PHT54_03775 [Candidatus Nanoarchaeia archaeon]|nr:hypothetical protein [Candidatus Nanoarchaeia archaeon]
MKRLLISIFVIFALSAMLLSAMDTALIQKINSAVEFNESSGFKLLWDNQSEVEAYYNAILEKANEIQATYGLDNGSSFVEAAKLIYGMGTGQFVKHGHPTRPPKPIDIWVCKNIVADGIFYYFSYSNSGGYSNIFFHLNFTHGTPVIEQVPPGYPLFPTTVGTFEPWFYEKVDPWGSRLWNLQYSFQHSSTGGTWWTELIIAWGQPNHRTPDCSFDMCSFDMSITHVTDTICDNLLLKYQITLTREGTPINIESITLDNPKAAFEGSLPTVIDDEEIFYVTAPLGESFAVTVKVENCDAVTMTAPAVSSSFVYNLLNVYKESDPSEKLFVETNEPLPGMKSLDGLRINDPTNHPSLLVEADWHNAGEETMSRPNDAQTNTDRPKPYISWEMFFQRYEPIEAWASLINPVNHTFLGWHGGWNQAYIDAGLDNPFIGPDGPYEQWGKGKGEAAGGKLYTRPVLDSHPDFGRVEGTHTFTIAWDSSEADIDHNKAYDNQFALKVGGIVAFLEANNAVATNGELITEADWVAVPYDIVSGILNGPCDDISTMLLRTYKINPTGTPHYYTRAEGYGLDDSEVGPLFLAKFSPSQEVLNMVLAKLGTLNNTIFWVTYRTFLNGTVDASHLNMTLAKVGLDAEYLELHMSVGGAEDFVHQVIGKGLLEGTKVRYLVIKKTDYDTFLAPELGPLAQ